MQKKKTAKTEDRRPRRVITAIAIKPPPDPEEDAAGNPIFQICFVQTSGALSTRECTKTVYQQILTQRLTHNHRDDFKLRESADGKLITSIDTFPKAELHSVFKTTSEDENGGSLAFQKHSDATFSLKSMPSNIPTSVASDISNLLAQYPDVQDGDYLDGKYRVAGMSKRGGVEMIFINPE